jgi:hypothetical protein
MKKTQIPAGMRALVGQIQKIKEQQKRLGLFCEDRDLLSCPRCDIEEDVTFEGFLIVLKRSKPDRDIGIRFAAIDEVKGLYKCPGCGKEIVVPASAI